MKHSRISFGRSRTSISFATHVIDYSKPSVAFYIAGQAKWFCLHKISINVNKLFTLLLLVYFVYVCPCKVVVAFSHLYPFFILMLLPYFCLFDDHVNKSIVLFLELLFIILIATFNFRNIINEWRVGTYFNWQFSLLHRDFNKNLLRGNRRRNICFHICFRLKCLTWGLNYLLDYGNFLFLRLP